MTPRFRILLDMDGVLVDFDEYCRRMGLTPEQVKSQSGAYLVMRPVIGALEGIRKLMSIVGMYGGEVWLATKPPTGIPIAYADKVAWVLNHTPELKSRIILTHDKGMLGDEMDYLVDDRPWRANADKFRGTLIQFGDAPWPRPREMGPKLLTMHRTPADWGVLVDYLHSHIRGRWPRLQEHRPEHSLEDINAARDLMRLGHLTEAEAFNLARARQGFAPLPHDMHARHEVLLGREAEQFERIEAAIAAKPMPTHFTGMAPRTGTTLHSLAPMERAINQAGVDAILGPGYEVRDIGGSQTCGMLPAAASAMNAGECRPGSCAHQLTCSGAGKCVRKERAARAHTHSST